MKLFHSDSIIESTHLVSAHQQIKEEYR